MIFPALYEKLKDVARSEGLITYQVAADLVNLNMDRPDDRNAIAAMLDEINEFERAQNRPMLSSIVVHADAQEPGSGFFECARRLGMLTARDKLSEVEFWAREVKRVYDFWTRN